MPPKQAKKSKCTRDEVLERRAQVAWEYRQRHKDTINEKAKLRMRKSVLHLHSCPVPSWLRYAFRRREQLKTAPSDIQLEHALRAAQYRRNYVEQSYQATRKAAPQTQKNPTNVTPSRVSKPKPSAASQHTAVSRKTSPAATHKHKQPELVQKSSAPAPGKPRPRAPHSPTPLSLMDIDRGESDEEDDGEEDDDGWDADTEREGLRPLLNPAGHQDWF
ncbi:hypothetical protein GGX14DRAFT_558721 [Mycena pura]|uniref:Uncharacterized protein n=1 Tax=Mycena pura TaxID=153505 RepID=A0AAD6YLC5_9AGAR|nr:hypothetical protein GGX14DRAFT_558721 [Mycena pura]